MILSAARVAMSVQRSISAEQRRALRLLAGSPLGCTEAILLAHGLKAELLALLVRDGLVTLGTIFEAIYPILWSRFLLILDSCASSKMPNNRSTPVVNKEIRDGQAEFYTRNMMREAQ